MKVDCGPIEEIGAHLRLGKTILVKFAKRKLLLLLILLLQWDERLD